MGNKTVQIRIELYSIHEINRAYEKVIEQLRETEYELYESMVDIKLTSIRRNYEGDLTAIFQITEV